jgi:hypothetical protein
MSRKKLSRNAQCPCGSGKKYKACCLGKGFDWEEGESGTIFKSIPMSSEMREVLDQLRQTFIAKHGREPGPGDPLFDDLPPAEHLEAMMVEDMKAAGLDPAFIYAFEKTGLLVTEQNQDLIPVKDLAEWDAAIEEYERKQRKKPLEYPIGTVALYGPDDKRTPKIAAGVILHEGGEAILKRWVASDVTISPKVQQEMKDFFLQNGVKSVAMTDSNMGCPHEESFDFPQGEDCPFCPFWKGKQGSNRKD